MGSVDLHGRVRMDAANLVIGCDPSVTLSLGWHAGARGVVPRFGGDGIACLEREERWNPTGLWESTRWPGSRGGSVGGGEDNREKDGVS